MANASAVPPSRASGSYATGGSIASDLFFIRNGARRTGPIHRRVHPRQCYLRERKTPVRRLHRRSRVSALVFPRRVHTGGSS